jgi:release factor glutamine methyltransferase
MNLPDGPASCREALLWATRQLNSRLEAELLLALALDCDRTRFYAHPDAPCPGPGHERFVLLVERRRHGEPIAYLTGQREFYSREFQVTPEVLIPRPETENLVEHCLKLDLPADASVLDIGTGSGCIALTLALERPRWRVCAVDISPGALAVAEANRVRLGADNVELLPGDLFEAVAERRFDLIASNPPYVAAGDEHLSRGDVRFEPDTALVAGSDGLELIARIVGQAPARLHPGGWLVLEHGHDQAGRVRSILEGCGFEQVHSVKDLAGIERVSCGRRT